MTLPSAKHGHASGALHLIAVLFAMPAIVGACFQWGEGGPTPPPPHEVRSQSASVTLSAATPVAIRDVTVTVDGTPGRTVFGTTVFLTVDGPAVRVAVVDPNASTLPVFVPAASSGPHYAIGEIGRTETSFQRRVIVELVDRSAMPATVGLTLVAEMTGIYHASFEPVPFDLAQSPWTLAPPPVTVAAVRSGEATLVGPATPGSPSAAITLRLTPGQSVASRLLVATWTLKAAMVNDGQVEGGCTSIGIKPAGIGEGGALLCGSDMKDGQRVLHFDTIYVPQTIHCADGAACVLDYEMQVYRNDNSAGTILWQIDAALIDYGSTTVPLDRGVSIEVDGLPSEGSPLESPLAR